MNLGNERIVEVIREGEIIRMPESRAVEEDLFVLRRILEPENEVMPEVSVRRNEPKIVESHSRLESWRAGNFGVKKSRVADQLVENFHWHVSRARRKKGFTRAQLANAIDVSEESIKTIEFGDLPSDDFILISKLENYLGISLRKEQASGANLADLQRAQAEKVEREREEALVRQRGEVVGDDLELVD